MKNFRRLAAGAWASLLAIFSAATCRGGEALGLLLAQEGGVSVTKGGKGYLVEILVTVALFGLALWVVCRSSRRV